MKDSHRSGARTVSGQGGSTKGAFRVLAPIAVLLLGALVAAYLMRSRPSAERRPPAPVARLVEVQVVRHAPRPAVVEAVGTVIPSRRVEMRPEVGGTVVDVAAELEPGGRFEQGDVLFAIDPRDYDLAIAERRAELAEAEGELRLEMGNQIVAEREFALLGEPNDGVGRDLALRAPQLRTVQARIDRARAALQAAELARARTIVRAPFAAVVEERHVELGSRVDPGTVAAVLVASDAYWVEVGVPAADLRWIRMPTEAQSGSVVRVRPEGLWAEGVERSGRVVRRHAALESEGRLARLLVEVRDPLAGDVDGATPLLLGSVVRVAIEGVQADGVPIHRSHLREGERVWVLADDDTLEIRDVEVGFRARSEVFVTRGLSDGERVVTSDMAVAVDGMPLRVAQVRRDG